MKISDFILLLLFFFTTVNLPFTQCMLSAVKLKQDAITSLVIFARSQAELQRDKQFNVLKNHNSTYFNSIEFANLLKKRETVNLKKIAENLKNTTNNETKKNTTIVINKSKKKIEKRNSTNLTKAGNITKSNNNTNKKVNDKKKINLRKEKPKPIPKKEKKVANSSIHNITITSKNATNTKSIKNNTKIKSKEIHPPLQGSIHNKKLIML